uniref:Uncharacterized protein n=1 Tax=Globisporangium ultimum (strain ATCC 200006 / CBS 805.95 / DAOM BR144) TaxID=431595 RepID=K3XAB3_GLOUD
MPLFESVEGDLTAFFVSQGSVFDSLVKSFMERLVLMETRINTLSIDMSSNFQNVHELIHSANMSKAAAIAALALTHEAHEAAPVQQKATPDYNAAVNVNVNHMGSDELEYYIMTLSRQLHLVLELFFQPYALDAMSKVQSKQAQFQTISDVLTQNEAILMQLSALERSEQRLPPEQERDPVDGQGNHDREEVRQTIDSTLEAREKNEGDEEEKYQEAEVAVDASQLDKEEAIPNAEHEMAPPDCSNLDASEPSAPDTEPAQPLVVDNDEAPENAPEVKVEVEIPPTELDISIKDDPKDQGDIQDTSFENIVIPEQERNEVTFPFPKSRRGTKRDNTQCIGDNNRKGTGIAMSRQRKQSLYDSFREFHERQSTEEERQRLRDEELLHKMQQMVLSSCRNTRREIIPTLSSMWQERLAELERQQIKLRTEWQQQQQQQVTPEVLERQQQQLQQEIDRQLMAFLSTQQVQEQQTTEIWTRIHDFPNQFMRKEDFEEMATMWLQSARDECVFGVSAGALTAFKDELSELQGKLQTLEAPSPEMEQLLAEVQRVLELLTKVLELLEADGLHSPQGVQMMQTVCTLLTMVDDLAQNMQNDQESDATSAAFISEALRRMELGTVNLLEAFEAQQNRYQQAFEQQHAAIAQLQRELWEQKQADQELKNQLAECPSQEDTMRFIQELRDQISMARSDSAMRMLETVDALRLKMSGLPTVDVIEKLRHTIQTKADRAEMDRLESLLAAANSSTNSAAPMAPFGSLMKAPMRCLSCDQTLPYVPTGSPPSLEHHGGPHLPRTCFHHPHPQDPSEQPHYYDDTHTGSGIGFRELFAPSVAAVRRRKEREHNLPLLGLPQNTWTVNAAVPSRATFVNLDDGRNRIPLRKTLLSDQVIYGPAITPNAFRKREFYRFDGQQTARPKTALPSDRRGEIITRSISSTVVIRPFAEQQQSEELETTRSKR